MPFRADELRARFAAAIEQGRMGHSYLLTGDRAESLENLALGLAGQGVCAWLARQPVLQPAPVPYR